MGRKIIAVVVEPGKDAEIKEIDSSLESLQAIVGGYIEAIYPFEDKVALICNEEGKLISLPFNRFLRDEYGHVCDIIAGTFLITGLTDENFGSLSEDLAKKYKDKFNDKDGIIIRGMTDE